jgi:hypothetical protein
LTLGSSSGLARTEKRKSIEENWSHEATVRPAFWKLKNKSSLPFLQRKAVAISAFMLQVASDLSLLKYKCAVRSFERLREWQ